MHEKIPDLTALAALPVGTVVRDTGGTLIEVAADGRARLGIHTYLITTTMFDPRVDFPMTVLYRPDLPDQDILMEFLEAVEEMGRDLARQHKIPAAVRVGQALVRACRLVRSI